MFAAEAAPVFLGEDLLAWLVLAIGGAMAAGSLLAVLRPPARPAEANDDANGGLARAPVARSLAMAAIGLVAALWALASLLR